MKKVVNEKTRIYCVRHSINRQLIVHEGFHGDHKEWAWDAMRHNMARDLFPILEGGESFVVTVTRRSFLQDEFSGEVAMSPYLELTAELTPLE